MKVRTPNKSDRQRLQGVKPDLVRFVFEMFRAFPNHFDASCWRLRVNEGVRSIETQQQYVDSGASEILDSRHLTGDAVDVVIQYRTIREDGSGYWVTRWEKKLYCDLADLVGWPTAEKLNLKLRWGGDWDSDGDYTDSNLFDGPHWERPKEKQGDES